jgi:hypothetical protein
LLGTSDEITFNAQTRGWVEFTFSTGVTLAAGTYWLGIHAGVTDNGSFFYYDTNQGAWAQNIDSYPDGASAGFGTPTTFTRQLAVFATYTAGVVATDGYAFVRMAETGITKFIFIDEMVMREIPVNAVTMLNPVGADLDVALVSLRANRVLNAVGWPVADRAIDTGSSILAAKTLDPVASAKALNELQDIADAELGVFFCDKDGKATLHSRARRFNPVPAATFTDSTLGPGLFPYKEGGLATSYDETRWMNDVRVTPDAGVPQIASDAASQSKTGTPRTLSKGLAVNTDQQALFLAQGILTRTKDPHLRVERLNLAPVAHESLSPGLLNNVLAREVSDCVTVKYTPPGGGAQVSKNVHLEKASFSLEKPGFLNVEWQLSPVDATQYFVAADPVYGAPDTYAAAF